MRYRIATERRGAQEIFLLHDDTTGASAAVLPSHGFNLFDLRLLAAGEPRRMVYAADDFAENPRPGAGNGTPILFPFPNRIGQAAFKFQGRTFSLSANNGPNAIHGFAVGRALAGHRAQGRRKCGLHHRPLSDFSRFSSSAVPLAGRRRHRGSICPGGPAIVDEHYCV